MKITDTLTIKPSSHSSKILLNQHRLIKLLEKWLQGLHEENKQLKKFNQINFYLIAERSQILSKIVEIQKENSDVLEKVINHKNIIKK